MILRKFSIITFALLMAISTFYTSFSNAATSESYDFNTAGDLANYFDATFSSGSYSQTLTGGIGNTGAINAPSNLNAVFASKTSYSIGSVGSSYTFSSYMQSIGNAGYSGVGFSATPSSSGARAQYRPNDALGISVHGGGFVFHNGTTDYNGDWQAGGANINAVKTYQRQPGDPEINGLLNQGSPVDWYKVIFKIEVLAGALFNIRVEVWPALADGTLIRPDSADAIYEVRSISNAAISGAPTIKSYINFSGDRVRYFDNFAIDLGGNASIISAGYPVVVTNAQTVSGNQVTFNGNVTSENGSPVTERGFVYGTSDNPTVTTDNKVSIGTGLGSFSETVTGLSSGTYYARAFATNSTGTSYGSSVTFTVVAAATAPSAPTINSITGADKSLIVAFTAGSTGGAAITDYEYSIDGGAYVSAGTTSSPFTITGLQGRTSYSITLKARNSVGLGTASSPSSATTTDAALDASEAAAAAEAARRAAEAAAAREARREAAAEAARQEAANKELASRLSIEPTGGAASQSGQSFTVNGATSFSASIAPDIKSNYPNVTEIKVSGNTVEVITADSFSGKMTVPVTITENGATTTINFEVVVNPKPVIAPRSIPVSRNLSNIKWSKSPNAIEYVIKINGREICRTAQESCSLPRIIGPKTKVTVTSLGNDGTSSEEKLPVFVSERPIPVSSLKVASSATALTQQEIKKLKEIVDLVKKEGFTKVAVSVPGPTGIADLDRKSFNNKSKDVAKYLLKYVDLELDPIEAKPASSGKTQNLLIAGVRISVIYKS